MPSSRPSSVGGMVCSLLSRNRIRRITATSPTTMNGCAASRCARSDSTTVCTISTRISTSSTRSSKLMAAVPTGWCCTSVMKPTTPDTASVAASTISTTPTVTVTMSWACSSAQMDPATTGRGAGGPPSGSVVSGTRYLQPENRDTNWLDGGQPAPGRVTPRGVGPVASGQSRRVVGDEGLDVPGHPDVALGRRSRRQGQPLPPHVVVGDGGQQVGDHVDPGPPLIVAFHHVPRCLRHVRMQQHLVLGPAVVLPAGHRLQVHRGQLPPPHRVLQPGPETQLLLRVADREPVLAEQDAVLHQQPLEDRALVQEPGVLLLRAESHHVLD